jgi:type I restriction enzyme, R subunit
MHDKVRKHWAAETARVQAELGVGKTSRGQGKQRPSKPASAHGWPKQRLQVLTTTDMAVIVSPGQNEIEQMQKLGPRHRAAPQAHERLAAGLDEKFKDTDDPLRLVFVCAMWLTGFDAPSCSTVYLDKPMRNHTLMQTIARANRVFPGKHSGVIVDYANVFASLEKALAIYGAGKGGKPTRSRTRRSWSRAARGGDRAPRRSAPARRDLAAIEALPPAGMERSAAIDDASTR